MSKFEYKYLELQIGKGGTLLHDLAKGTVAQLGNTTDYGPELVEYFNRLGANGWELTGFAMSPPGSQSRFEYIFKRQMK